MKSKKNPKVDLSKNSTLYFALGLCLILFVCWRLIEWKTYEKSLYGYETLDVENEDDEEIPITEQLKTPPPPQPPPPPAPEVIEVVQNEEEVEETVIESTETHKDEIIEVEEVETEEEEEEIPDVPFSVIEDVPIFPGCESVSKSKLRDCFQEQMNKHIRKHFRYPEIAQEMGIQGRVLVTFIISNDGSIINIKMRGPDKNLEEEAKRIISLLPKMTPGKQRGVPVRVPFSIPIVFRLQ
jgi:protein TonB